MSRTILSTGLGADAVIAIIFGVCAVLIGLYIFAVFKYQHPNLVKRAGKIERGMTLDEVYAIMRYPSEGAIERGNKVTVVWRYGKRNIYVVFINERVSAVEVIHMGEPPL